MKGERLNRAKRCTTHYHACECREYKYRQMELALKVIAAWASSSSDDRRPIHRQMADIENQAMAALDCFKEEK